MAKEELITLEGLVTELLPDARFRVQLDTGHTIVAYTAGRMKKHRIKTLAGDLLLHGQLADAQTKPGASIANGSRARKPGALPP